MDPLPVSAKLAQMLGITGSAFLSGVFVSSSILAIPPLTALIPPLQVQQWRSLYRRGLARAPPLALFSSSLLLYASYSCYSQSSLLPNPTWKHFAAAAVLKLSSMPFTLVIMAATNGKLLALAERVDAKGDVRKEEVERLVQTWKTLNLARAMFPSLGAGVALYRIMF